MGLYLKICLGDWKNSSRDRRELRAAKELGFDILVIASSKEGKTSYSDKVEEFDVVRIPTRKYGTGRMQRIFGYISGLFMFIGEARKVDAQIISGHNYDGVLVGYLSQRHKKNKARLLYDCHEFELFQKKRKPFVLAFVKLCERFVLKHSNVNMMVTDSIAEEVKKIYSLKECPIVVRNVPPQKEIDQCVVVENRKEFFNNLDITEKGLILIHHGGIAPGRGIEETILAVSRLDNVGLVVMGYALDEPYKDSILRLTKECKVESRVYFKDAVSFERLYEYVAAADLAIVLIQNTCRSFLYSLPNKLFESIQSCTPIIGSDFPEIGAIIDKYGVGIKIKPDDIDALEKAIIFMRDNKDRYQKYKENEIKAREELCWQTEKKKLQAAITEMISSK